MKNLLLLFSFATVLQVAHAQKKNDANTLLKDFSENACQCIDSINVYDKERSAVTNEINTCIDKQVVAYQLMAQLTNSDLLGTEQKKRKKKKSININLSTDKNSTEYKNTYYELERELMESCDALKLTAAAYDKQSRFSMSTNPEALEWYEKGNDAKLVEKYNVAIQHYKKALSIDSMFCFAWDNLGLAYRKAGRYDDALQAYQKSISIDPNGQMPWQNIAVVYEYKKDYQQAIIAYEALAKLDPNNPEVYYGVGRVYGVYTGELEKGLDNMCKAYILYVKQQSPYRADAENLIGYFYNELKKQDKEKVFNEILEKNNIKQN